MAKPASAPPSASDNRPSVQVGDRARLRRRRRNSPRPKNRFPVPPAAPARSFRVAHGSARCIRRAKERYASRPVSRATGEKLARRSAARRKARQERAAIAKRKQYAAPRSQPTEKSPGTTSQTPSISTRLSEQWWR